MNIFYIRLILGVVISLIVVDLNAQTAFYLRDSRPWNVQSGQPGSNEKAMDKVFQNNWQTVIYSNANPNVIFSSNTHFVFLEGSDTSANALNYFLTSNRSIIEQWVFNGGRLLINAAPNQGGHIDFGFNGVTLQYPSFTPNAVAVDGTHAVFNGPHGSTGTSWSGNWFGHAAISGTGLNALIRNSTNNEIILAEKKIGSGIVLFGGMTLQHYHSPKPQVYNLRANILEYLNSAVICVSPTLTVPALQAISSDLNTCGATVEFTASATGTSPDISYSIDIEGIDTEIYSPHFFPIGSTVITASAVNDCGTTESKTFTITVEDITAPVVDAKSAVTVTLDSSGAGSLAVADVLNSASTDVCGISSEVLSQTSFGCTDVGTFNITLTVKDVNDNETVETISVTVVDDTDPVVDAKSAVTVTLDSYGAGSLAVADVLNSASTDACGISSEVLSQTSFGCTDVGTFNITLTVKDVNDNETVETISVTVVDDTDPVVDAKSAVTVTLDSYGAGSLAVADVLNSASTDACGISSEVLSQTSFGCADVGTFNITLTVKDVNDNQTVEIISVTVVDDTDPVVDAKSAVTVTLDSSGAGSLAVADVLNSSSTDACGISSEVLSQTSFGCTDVGTFNITLTVKDVNDNETVETISVTVVDDTDPVVDAKSAVTVTLDSSGAGSLAVADVLNSASTDACGISSEVLSQTSFGCADVGAFNITLTVKDVNDNETMKTVSVTVVNDTPILSTIIGPTGPQPVNSLVTLSATVTDINPASAQFYFSTDGGDSFGQPIDVGVGEQGNIIYYFTPQEPQVYLVKLVVTDICGLTAVEEFRYVVIFDPNGGFVTGGGTIWSPAGAFKADNTIEGPANFGFNAKYKSGKNYTNEVDGSTNFQFKAGNFHFKSTSHEDESLVVSGGFKATYKGYGTVNGNGNYQFLVTVIDADQTTNYSTDLYRIKIWDGNGIAYDNNLGNTEDNADPAIAITGGSIVIHKPKGGGNQKEQQEVISAQSIESVNMLETMSVSPNPVVSTATVSFSLNMNTEVALEVFDYSQRRVKLLYNGKILSGQVREVVFDREGLPSGTYFVKLTASNGQVFSKQIIIN